MRGLLKDTSPLGGEAHINQIVFRSVREGLVPALRLNPPR